MKFQPILFDRNNKQTTLKFKKRLLFSITILFFLVLLVGCEKKNKQQLPGKLVWDRNICEECSMVISDRRYAVQVVAPDGKPFMFDDIGCAIDWLNKQSWQSQAKIWTQDYETEKWLAAEDASWKFGDPNTPMGYGFSATEKKFDNAIQFEKVIELINNNKTLRHHHLKKQKKTP